MRPTPRPNPAISAVLLMIVAANNAARDTGQDASITLTLGEPECESPS